MKYPFHAQFFRVVFTAVLLFPALPPVSAQPSLLNRTYTPAELQEDWSALRTWMENHHPNLYLYTPKTVIDSVFDAVAASLTTPMTADRFYKTVCAIQPYVRDGHNVLLPSKQYMEHCYAHAPYFPLTVAWLDGNLVIIQNLSDEPSLTPGTVIQQLNGRQADAVFNDMVGRLMRDGDNLHYPEYLAQAYFRSFYGFFNGFPETHELTVTLPGGSVRHIRLKALPLDTLQQRRRTIQPRRYDRLEHDKAVFWVMEPNSNLGVLSIRTWHKDQLKNQYKQSFKKEIDACIKTLNDRRTEALIIDLRGNQGGEALNGIYLAQRLLDEPFTYVDEVKTFNRQHKLVKTYRKLTRTYKPVKERFQGKIAVLVDGGSYSNSALFAALMQKHKRAVIAGSETGGSRVILAGGSKYFAAPNTQMQVLKATNRYVITTGEAATGQGVQPDVVFKPSPEQVIRNSDVLLEDILLMFLEK